MGKALLVAVLELAARHGIPAVLDAVNRCRGEVTVEKVRSLVDLVRDPDAYDKEA